ncbi:hypothetical protein N431DRAFT_448229 [Stipitochalara longipes BDJ]|nr:hypothetical protein N431DRAFT_448229 [Stipitochalara longipes BDJ]
MAKRRKVKSSPNKAIKTWSREEQLTLLAWLDFSLKYKDVNFDETIVDHLGGAFTQDQIERKLQAIWKWGGQHQPGLQKRGAWRVIKSRGSSSLHSPHGLDEDGKNEIALAVAKLEKTYLPETTTPNHRLRSNSRVETGSSNQDSRLNIPIVKKHGETRGCKRKSGTDSLTPPAVKLEIVQADTESSKPDKRRKIAKTYSKRDRARSIRATACSPETPPSLQEQRPRPQARERRSLTLIKDSEDGVSDTLDEQLDGFSSCRELSIPFGPLETEDSDTHLSPDSQPNSIHNEKRIRCICRATVATHSDGNDVVECSQCKVLHHAGCLRYLCQECNESAEKIIAAPETRYSAPRVDSSTETDEIIDPRVQSAIFKIQELQESLLGRERELQESKQFVEELNRDIHHLNMAQKQRDDQHGSPIEELLVKKQKQVHNLLNDLKARRRLGTFTNLPPASRFQGTKTDVKIGFEEAYHNSHMIFRRLEIKQFPCIPQLRLHETLLGLAHRVTGSKPDPALQSRDRDLLSIEPVVLLRSLSTAALQEWIFEADFPNFEDDSSITLAAYRDLLANQDGALALRNLDLAAFEAKINSPEFRTLIVPKEAQRLAIQLSQALAPFFTRNTQAPEGRSWDGFATWSDETKIWKDRQENLVKMFVEALTTKASSCLNIQNYEMIIYPPGTKFDSNTMEAERMDGTADISDCDGRVVQICVQAAVFVYARSPVTTDGSVSESIIPTRNFVRRSENERIGVIPYLKAVVVLVNAE